MDFELSQEQLALRAVVHEFATQTFASKASDWDEKGTFLPAEDRKRLAELGLLGITISPEYGGAGASLVDALIAIEELAKVSQIPAFQVFEANTGPARVVEFFGNDEQKRQFLPPIVSGDKTMAVSISEPDAGSAATDLSTSAVRDGDYYILNGSKRWCSGAGHAEQYLVYVRLGPEKGHRAIGAIVVERDTPGLEFGQNETLMGFHGIPSADMHFSNVRVSAENLIIDEGGFSDLFSAFSIERLGNATMSLAIGQSCLDRSIHHVQERVQFGKPIIEFQLVQAALAEMVMDVEAARMLIWKAATKAENLSGDFAMDVSVAKCFANEMAKRVADKALQLHGGYGYSKEYEIERFLRDSHGWALAGGTPSIQKIRIVSELVGRSFNQRA